jgi:hypothetical protein
MSSQQSSKHTKLSILCILGFGTLSLLFHSGIHYFGNCKTVGKGRRTQASASLIAIGFQAHAYLLRELSSWPETETYCCQVWETLLRLHQVFSAKMHCSNQCCNRIWTRFGFCVGQNLKAQKEEGHEDRERVSYLYMLVEWKEQRTKTGKLLDLQGFKRDLSWSCGQESAISLGHQDACSWHFSADSKGDHSQHRELAYIANK